MIRDWIHGYFLSLLRMKVSMGAPKLIFLFAFRAGGAWLAELVLALAPGDDGCGGSVEWRSWDAAFRPSAG